MNSRRSLFATLPLAGTLLAAALVPLGGVVSCRAADWPGFRGVDGCATVSVEDAKNLPADFDGPSGKLIRWKTPLTLPGESSPIVTGNRVFLTSADLTKRILFCFDGDTGKLLWQQGIDAKGKNPGDPGDEPPAAGLAAPTPATDGRSVVALFGNGDIAAFDLTGKQLWARNLGTPESGYGFASSPIVHGDRVIVQFDQGTDATEVESFLLALDLASGKTVWRTKRPVHASWTTPIVISVQAKAQVITVADPWIIAYAFDTGTEIWRAKCMGQDCAPSAAFAGGIVYAALARVAMTAVKTDGQGDVTATHIAWRNDDNEFPEVPSPVTNGKQVFLALDRGLLVGYDAANGKQLWELDRDTEFRSSPTLVGDQVWVFDRKGILHRVAAGPEAKLLGTANLGEKTDAQPAYAGNRIYIRGKTNLICIGAK